VAKFPDVQDKLGRVVRVVTSQDELDSLKAQGYTPVRRATTEGTREPLNTGSGGQQAARASSTTEGSETNSGDTTPSPEEVKAEAVRVAKEQAAEKAKADKAATEKAKAESSS